MSSTISNSFGTMPTLLRGIDKLNAQNNDLTAQISSGVVADSISGLGEQAYQAVSLEPQITAMAAWQTNLSQTQTKLSATQAALSGISAIASSLQTSLTSMAALNSPSEIAAASDSAKQQLTALTSLLNTRSGDAYVFAGAASDQPPVSGDLATGSAVSSIMSAVAAVGTTGASATESATLASAGSANIFSVPLAAGDSAPQVQVGQDQTIASGIVATQGGCQQRGLLLAGGGHVEPVAGSRTRIAESHGLGRGAPGRRNVKKQRSIGCARRAAEPARHGQERRPGNGPYPASRGAEPAHRQLHPDRGHENALTRAIYLSAAGAPEAGKGRTAIIAAKADSRDTQVGHGCVGNRR